MSNREIETHTHCDIAVSSHLHHHVITLLRAAYTWYCVRWVMVNMCRNMFMLMNVESPFFFSIHYPLKVMERHKYTNSAEDWWTEA